MTDPIDNRPVVQGFSPVAHDAEGLDMFIRWIGDLVATAAIMRQDGDACRGPEECEDQVEAILVATSELVRTARAHAIAIAEKERKELHAKAVKEQAVAQNAG